MNSMNQATKTKIIVIASFGIFALLVSLLAISFTSKRKDRVRTENISVRADIESDFTIEDLMSADSRTMDNNPYNITYSNPDESQLYNDDEEVKALQRQLRANLETAEVKKRYDQPVKTEKKEIPETAVDIVSETPEIFSNIDSEIEEANIPEKRVSRFYTATNSQTGKNTISVSTVTDQTVTAGSTIKLITNESITLDNIVIPAKTILTGVVSFSNDRMKIEVKYIAYNNSIYTLNKNVYDKDGMEGIPLNKSTNERSRANEIAERVNVPVGGVVVRSATEAIKGVFRKDNSSYDVTVKANYNLLLK